MVTTALWDVRSALVGQFTAALTAAAIDISIFDGPRARSTEPKLFLLVGSDGGEDGTGDMFVDAITVTQEPSAMGNGWREESGEVLCAAWAWSGSTDVASLRRSVAAVIDACAAQLSSDRTLGGLLTPADAYAEFAGIRIREGQGTRGAVIRAAFTVTYHRALLT